MPKNPEKLSLGENHRRVVSALLRRIESTCDEVMEWLRRPSGNLLQFTDDVTPKHADELRALVSGLREENGRVRAELLADASVQSRARGIAASVSLTRIEIEEVFTPGLRGYGPLPPEMEAALDAKLRRLLTYLEAMSAIAERSGSRGAA